MKNLIKTIVLPVLFLFGITTQVTAQLTRNKRSTERTSITRRVPSTRITYRKPRKKIVSVRNLPNRRVISHKGRNYYHSNNKFYTQSRGRYIEISPKIGFRINILPTGHRRVHYKNRNYYNVNGVFYVKINNEYEVVEPEVGTIVYELPRDYEKVILDERTYYEYANVLYEKIQVDGTRAYEVVSIIDVN